MSATAERCLRADEITVRFGALVAVSSVSVKVQPGEIVGLIGPNGAGKSTFFNALTGFLRGAEGAATVNGTDIARKPPWTIAGAGVSRTFQNRSVFPELSVRENLALAETARRLRARRHRAAHGHHAFTSTKAWNDLEDFVLASGPTTDARNLAYGQQRFLSLAMALATEPLYLLLDEPAAGLNASESRMIGDLLLAARENDIGIVLVEHDMTFLMSLVEHVFVLDAGKLIAAGSPAAIQADPGVRAAYLGGPTPDA